MTKASLKTTLLLAAAAGALGLSACASKAPTSVPENYLVGTPLDRNAPSVTKRTEFLEIAVDPTAAQIAPAEAGQIEDFVDAYRDHGHGPLILSLPTGGANPQYAVELLTEARAIAWENGVEYEEMAGTSHNAGGDGSTMILAFQTYDAIAPNCKPISAYDLADVSNNNELERLGCAMRTNLAHMIADPADLLGGRQLDDGDYIRKREILRLFRAGESTASARGDGDDGSVSQAVN